MSRTKKNMPERMPMTFAQTKIKYPDAYKLLSFLLDWFVKQHRSSLLDVFPSLTNSEIKQTAMKLFEVGLLKLFEDENGVFVGIWVHNKGYVPIGSCEIAPERLK